MMKLSDYQATRRLPVSVALLLLGYGVVSTAFTITSNPWLARHPWLSPRKFGGRTIASSRTRGSSLFVLSRDKSGGSSEQPPAAAKQKSEDDAKEEENDTILGLNILSSATPTPVVGAIRGQKFRRLKDMIWVRETIEDLTAAEFACTVEAASGDEARRRKRRRAVDYDKLLSQLNKRIQDLGCGISENDDSAALTCTLQNDVGMGTTIYNASQRNEMLSRILATRAQLIEVVRGYKLELEKEEDSKEMKFQIPLPSIQIQKEDDTSSPGAKIYVRDDGTVDWEGALQDRAAIKNFGTAVWARINGQDPSGVSEDDDDEGGENNNMQHGHGQEKFVTAKIEDTPEIVEFRERLNALKSELAGIEKAHYKLLSSALSEGQAVANVNLASLEPALRSRIRESAATLENMKQEVAYETLVYELERIYSYLVGEVGNPSLKGYVPLQDRLNVAEFGLLESQIDTFTRQLEAAEGIDGDLLLVVAEQVTDLKRRLGIDFYVTGLTFDGEAIKRFLADLWAQTKKGLAFYGKGIQLFWNDLLFCGFLIGRAVQGYTLKPREVRNLRRTIKDCFTFIPFIIILLIPLSPIGHVFVFGAIQRFFPEFFPSCFTETRQNLLQLYETAEYSEFKINESVQEKLSRLALATLYFFANTSKNMFSKVAESFGVESEVNGESVSENDSTPNDK